MKKAFLLSIIALMSLCTVSVYAQKKGKGVKATKLTPATPVLANESDSLSYVYGTLITQGLTQYLGQMGIIGDTAIINAEYKYKIEMESDVKKKAKLETALKNKVDSTLQANQKALADFSEGFTDVLHATAEKSAFHMGVSVATQVLRNNDQFATEILGDKDAFNKSAFAHAFINSVMGGTLLYTEENPQEKLQQQAEVVKARQAKKADDELKTKYKETIAAGDKFMAENKSKDGVATLASGLQYKVLTQGTGAKPSASDIVKVHYKGALIDGTEFDSSYNRGEPTTFSAGHVIKGWTEALTLMPVGSKWELYIPYDLAYGARDQGTIKPFSNLIFVVELLDILDAKEIEDAMQE